ncbi:hypothetical protein BaRGS_00022438 [Batillaria attramentaria]|uniref:Uncharacterized protein n=1 Tax=Batillaria attramentaria TaxID=370345 RepID=A0ABD0KGG7_9CAEN
MKRFCLLSVTCQWRTLGARNDFRWEKWRGEARGGYPLGGDAGGVSMTAGNGVDVSPAIQQDMEGGWGGWITYTGITLDQDSPVPHPPPPSTAVVPSLSSCHPCSVPRTPSLPAKDQGLEKRPERPFHSSRSLVKPDPA